MRVLLADPRELFRHAFRKALEVDGVHVAGEAGDAHEMLTLANRARPDVILLNADLPTGGRPLSYLIREQAPACRMLILAPQGNPGILVEALEAGASGFVADACSLKDVIDATRAVQRGEAVVPQPLLAPLLRQLLERNRELDEDRRRISRLTEREREVLGLIVTGSNPRSIASALVISPKTARTHIQRVLTKLELHSQIEAAAFVERHGIHRELAMSKQ